MWVLYYADGRVTDSEQTSWLAISRREELAYPDGQTMTFDVLREPAAEMRIRWPGTQTWHRVKAPTAEGARFFHYLRVRINLMDDGAARPWYEAAGYFFAHGRVVLEVTPGWSTTRVEYGVPQFDMTEWSPPAHA